jgi:hypothetical protein
MTWATSYHEFRFDGDQFAEVLDDRVVVKGKRTFGAEYECAVMLNSLDPTPNRFRVRPAGFYQGIFMAVVALFLTKLPIFALGNHYGGFAWVLVAAGLLLAIATAKKVEWAQFKTTSGAIAFNIAKAGRRGGNFDRFVEYLSRRIVESTTGKPSGVA